MARAVALKFELVFRVDFQTNIRGHHVYKDVWVPAIGEQLICKKDTREEANEYDEDSIGVFKVAEEGEDKKDLLVGHIPIELSKLLNQYLQADNSNIMIATVSGKRKRELGLVVPAKFKCITSNKKLAKILHDELTKKKTKFSYLELSVDPFHDRKRVEYQ